MVNLFQRRSEVDKRLKHLQKELSSVRRNLDSALGTPPPKPAAGHRDDKGSGGPLRATGRFADYLSASFQPMQPVRPLRQERNLQRNKAVVMSVFVLLVLFWIVNRFFR